MGMLISADKKNNKPQLIKQVIYKEQEKGQNRRRFIPLDKLSTV